MKNTVETSIRNPIWIGLAALLAAISASACCVAPLLFLSLGIGGAWISSLASMQAVRPVFMLLTLLFIGLAYRQLYLVPDTCGMDKVCASPSVKRKQRLLFWLGSVLLLALLAFPWYAPFFMG
ncbi:MAG: mercuric transporter MerT family protein [Methyloprofundus sp.]|nr:mercuric transporter MerT family protein [Methyloprofundus sp.]MDT8426139.1 mercuric transporter MerT family protein [Methyloprofundus sp.]